MKVATIAAAVALTTWSASAENVWWVDARNYGKTGLDGRTAETAFGTIQGALDNEAFEENDTVKVMPGVYDKGEHYQADSGMTNRLVISKACKIVSTEGCEKTHIVGRRSATSTGIGSDAIRCVYVCSGVSGTRLEGFTIRDGATATQSDNSSGYGGGCLCTSGKDLVVDCVISNCVAFKGTAVRNGTAIRTLATRNHTTKGDGSIFNGGFLYSCVVYANTGSWACSSSSGAGNTIVSNERGVTGGCSFYNTVLYALANEVGDSRVKLYGCVRSIPQTVVAPALGDYRPIAGSGLVGTGDASYFAEGPNVPTEERYLDFNRNPTPTSGTCDIGAVQGAANVFGGIQAGAGGLLVEGQTVPNGGWVFATDYPIQWRVQAVSVEGRWLYGFKRTDVQTDRFHPDLNDVAYVMPPPTGVSTVETVYADAAYWVNPNKDAKGNDIGSDDNPGTEAAPFHTLQQAMDITANSKYAVIFAAEGRYEEGGRCVHEVQQNKSFLTNRLCSASNSNYVRVRGAGVGKSFIVGAADPDTKGNGPKAVRPIGVFCNFVAVQGFTITNGYSSASTAVDMDKYGAVSGRAEMGSGCHILDCEIVDCHGSSGLSYRAQFLRCRFHGNSDANYVLESSGAISSLFADDPVKNGIAHASRLFNCTLVGASSSSGLSYNYNDIYASVLVNGLKVYGGDKIYGSLYWNITTVSAAFTHCTRAEPCFANALEGDFGVLGYSPALTCAGEMTADNWGATYWKYATSDLDGNKLIVTDGNVLAGCAVVAGSGVKVEGNVGGLSLANGWHPVGPGDSLVVSPTDYDRPCVGFTLNGVTNLFEDAASVTIAAADCLHGARLVPVYSKDWYVDASRQGQDGNGFTPQTAKGSFARLCADVQLLPGDVVHAAEGLYDSGVMYRAESEYTVGARLIVPAGVTVVADGRVESTVIKGADATNPINDYGMGDDAVRCVALNAGAKIRGFTLLDGRTAGKTDDAEASKTHPDNIGGCVQGVDQSANGRSSQVVEDCILKGGVAFRGGGAANVRLVRCCVSETHGTDGRGNGNATLSCGHFATVVGNVPTGFGVLYADAIVSSTIIGTEVYNPNDAPVNSILACPCSINSYNRTFERCYLASTPAGKFTEDQLRDGSKIVTYDDLQLDEQGRPVVGANVAVDKGSVERHATYRDILGDCDALGGQRVYNGAIDVGALEADWRDRYAQDLAAPRRFHVVQASEGVVESDGRTVVISPGESLEASLRGRGGQPTEFAVTVKVTGSGTLTVSMGDDVREVRDTADETQVLKFSVGSDDCVLRFSYVGTDGAAELVSAKSLSGARLILR